MRIQLIILPLFFLILTLFTSCSKDPSDELDPIEELEIEVKEDGITAKFSYYLEWKDDHVSLFLDAEESIGGERFDWTIKGSENTMHTSGRKVDIDYYSNDYITITLTVTNENYEPSSKNSYEFAFIELLIPAVVNVIGVENEEIVVANQSLILTSANEAAKYEWDINDDGIIESNIKDFNIDIDTPGIYEVRLTVWNSSDIAETVLYTFAAHEEHFNLELFTGRFKANFDCPMENLLDCPNAEIDYDNIVIKFESSKHNLLMKMTGTFSNMLPYSTFYFYPIFKNGELVLESTTFTTLGLFNNTFSCGVLIEGSFYWEDEGFLVGAVDIENEYEFECHVNLLRI